MRTLRPGFLEMIPSPRLGFLRGVFLANHLASTDNQTRSANTENTEKQTGENAVKISLIQMQYWYTKMHSREDKHNSTFHGPDHPKTNSTQSTASVYALYRSSAPLADPLDLGLPSSDQQRLPITRWRRVAKPLVSPLTPIPHGNM